MPGRARAPHTSVDGRPARRRQDEPVESQALDITNVSELSRLADEARQTQRPLTRRRGNVDVANGLWRLIDTFDIVENSAKVVAGTKTLHHLLPDLAPPMDRAWTGKLINEPPLGWQPIDNQRRIFVKIFSELARVARAVHPEDFVGAAWRSSRTKVLKGIGRMIFARCLSGWNRLSPPSSGGWRPMRAALADIEAPVTDWPAVVEMRRYARGRR